MKKKILILAAVFMLMFSFAGQAMAAFTSGDLIQVIYTNDGSGAELAVDLGSFNSHTTSSGISDTSFSNTVSLSSAFPGYSASQLNVSYYVFNSNTGLGNTGYWVVGTDESGLTNRAGGKSGTTTAFNNLTTYYNSMSGCSSVTSGAVSSESSSYWALMMKYGAASGGFDNYLPTGVFTEATLPSSGYVDQYLYYFPYNNSANAGVEIADIRTFADGHTEVIPTVPIPAAVWLLGSGLIGLVGIRRRNTTA